MSSSISRFMGRVAQQAHLILAGHVFNAPWRGREQRRAQRYKATRGAALRYLRRYAKAISEVRPQPIDMTPEPEKAFTIWFQGEEQAPALVKACFRSMRKHLKQPLVVLDEKTIFDWITLPDYIVKKWKNGLIPHAHFSDLCRIELLYQHGGLWFDATDYVTAPVPDAIMNEDVFLYLGGNKVRGCYASVQNCFMRAKKGNPLMGIWRNAAAMYWKDENSKINYFIHHLLLLLSTQVNPIAKESFDKMLKLDQDPTHTLWGEHCTDPYNEAAFKQLTSGACFQKTNYKDRRLAALPQGSVAEYILNSNKEEV